MSAFHPGTIEALLYEVAIHERFKEAAEAVADMYDNSEQRNRHAHVIADLTELIRLVEQGNADEAEQDRQAMEADAREQLAVVRVELVPARALDEDQPAAPACGHGHVLHACPPIGLGRAPRCGAAGPTALFASDVTCQECRSLMADQAHAAGEPGYFGDADEDFEFAPIGAQDYAAEQAAADANHAALRRTHVAERHGDQLHCVACSKREGTPILWPCLILAAVDVAEDFTTPSTTEPEEAPHES